MNWKKTIIKGIEGALMGGGAAGVATQDTQAALITAAITAVLRAAINWWKHK